MFEIPKLEVRKIAAMPRRGVFALAMTAVLAVGMMAGSAARAQTVPSSQAIDFITKAGNQLVAVINQGADSPARRQALQAIVNRDVDISGVAKFCLGRFWRTATPAQQQDYVNVFHAVMMRSLTANLGDYQGVTFTVGQTLPRSDGGVAVQTVLTRPNNAPNNVQWVVINVGGALKVGDVIVEGTSMKLTKRNEYASYLQNNGNDLNALIAALKAQSAGS